MVKQPVVYAIFSILMILAAGIDALAAEDSEGWTSLNEDLYINGRSIVRTSADTVSLWVKIVPRTGSELLRDARTQLMDRGKEYQAISYDYTGYLSEIDCSGKRHREVVMILYDANKNIILSLDRSSASWEVILPGSDFHLVQSTVCRQKMGVAPLF